MESAKASEAIPAPVQSSREQNRVRVASAESRLVWLALAAVLIAYIFSALRVGPVSNFGIEGDDALYFASAKALASGQGYVLPSFPVKLRATRYPELYPLLLACIWKLDSRFPGNVNWAVALTLVFGCMALGFAFLLLRRWPRFGDWDALMVVALCAISAQFIDLSASVLTDVPFMAMMFGAIWLVERNRPGAGKVQPRSGRSSDAFFHNICWAALGSGVLAGLSIGFRTLGAAVVGGIGLALLARRDYRKLLWFSLAAAFISVVMMWPQLAAMAHPSAMPHAIGHDGTGWTQTLCYYTSYACELRMDADSVRALGAIIATNLKRVLILPGLFILWPLSSHFDGIGPILVVLLSVAAYVGIARYTKSSSFRALPLTFLLYLLVVLPWPYTMDRLLVPFLPMFFGGLWLEGRNLARLVARYWRPPHGTGDRTVAGGMAAAELAIAAIIAVNYAYAVPLKMANLAVVHRKMGQDDVAAYRWIREHAPPSARLIAYNDGLCYLFTGRRSVVPIDFRTQAFYLHDREYAAQDAAHLADVARHIGATYWLATTEDFALAAHPDDRIFYQKQQELLSGSPVVFRSSDGLVRVFDVRQLTKAKERSDNTSPGIR